MSVQNVLNEFSGLYPSDTSALPTDVQDVLSDDIIPLQMLLDSAAGTDFTYGSFKAPFAFQVIDAAICPGAALTAADATANTYTLAKADGAGGAATTIASVSSATSGSGGSGNWVADTFVPLALSATVANQKVARGQIVTFKKTHASTGTVTPQSTLTIKIRRI